MIDNKKINKPVFTVNCINCGSEIIGTVGYLINRVPICDECRKMRSE